jgi:hypothetical protein
VSQSTYAASHSRDEGDDFSVDLDDEDDDVIAEDELGDDQDPTEKYRSER